MGSRNVILLVVAIGLGLIAVLLANSYFSGVQQRQQRVAEEQRLARIVVAAQPLEFGQPLTPENLKLANFPANSVPEGAFQSIEDATRGGRVTLRPIVPNEPVLADKVSGTDGRAVLAANLTPGMRAVAIPVTATSGVSGFVRPGDVVDVLLTRTIPGADGSGDNMMTDVILDRIKVLAIDQIANEKDTQPRVGSTAVLEVDPYGAQKIALAEKLGSLSLALRNVANQEQRALSSVTARDLGLTGARVAQYQRRPRPEQSARQPQLVARDSSPSSRTSSTPTAAPQPRTSAPTMTIYRGVQPTEESVGRLGGL